MSAIAIRMFQRCPKMRHYDVPRLATEPPIPEYWSSLDCAIISTDHSIFDWDQIVQYSNLVVDCRNATQGVMAGQEKMESLINRLNWYNRQI